MYTGADYGKATIRETKEEAYTAYREVVVESEARVTGKIEAIKEIRNSTTVVRGSVTDPYAAHTALGLAEAKRIVDTLWERGFRLVKIEE